MKSSNSFLAISAQSPSIAISRTRPNSWQQFTQMNRSSTALSQCLTADSNDILCLSITPQHGPRRKLSLSIVEACSPHHCIATIATRTTDKTSSLLLRRLVSWSMDVVWLRAYTSAVMCLPSRCLTMSLYVTIGWGHRLIFYTLSHSTRTRLPLNSGQDSMGQLTGLHDLLNHSLANLSFTILQRSHYVQLTDIK
jgi:hypothetical protein